MYVKYVYVTMLEDILGSIPCSLAGPPEGGLIQAGK